MPIRSLRSCPGLAVSKWASPSYHFNPHSDRTKPAAVSQKQRALSRAHTTRGPFALPETLLPQPGEQVKPDARTWAVPFVSWASMLRPAVGAAVSGPSCLAIHKKSTHVLSLKKIIHIRPMISRRPAIRTCGNRNHPLLRRTLHPRCSRFKSLSRHDFIV